MTTTRDAFDLVLSYSQWQGSGRPENLRRGGHSAAGICGNYGRRVEVPDAGEGDAKDGINRWTAILQQFRSARAILDAERPDRILTAGGDCACDIAIIDYLHQRYPDLTVVWVDAHLDANTPETSPSGNFHGMPVAAILGASPPDLTLSSPLPPSQFRYLGAHVGDEGDWGFQQSHGLAWLEPDEKLTGPVHIHFDLDALDPAQFPTSPTPTASFRSTTALRW